MIMKWILKKYGGGWGGGMVAAVLNTTATIRVPLKKV